MYSEPSKAAMERASAMLDSKWTHDETLALVETAGPAAAFAKSVLEVARYIDTVDRVAREIDRILDACGDYPPEATLRSEFIRTLMLPDEADAPLDTIMQEKGVSRQVRTEVLAALKSAGYTITKDAQP